MKPTGRPFSLPPDNFVHLDGGEEAELPICPRRFGFIFDCIILRMYAPTIIPKGPFPPEVSCEVDFNGMPLTITSSRINAVDFKRGHGNEFEKTIADLRSDMQSTPLSLRVLKSGQVIGYGSIIWPDDIIDRVDQHMGSLTHLEQCEVIDLNHEPLGTLEVLMRIFCKCDLDETATRLDMDTLQGALRRDIDSNDVFFLVGDDKEDCDSIGPAPYKPRKAPSFDLTPYHCLTGKTVTNTDAINSCFDKECIKKRNKPQFTNIVDKIVCAHREQKKKEKKHTKRHPPKPCPCAPSESSSEESDADAFPKKCFAKHHDANNDFVLNDKLMTVCPQVSCPKLQHDFYTRPRKCPICKQDSTWLPRNAVCPKCGYKPILQADEKPYDENVTAEQIIREYMEPSSTPLPSPKPSHTSLSNASLDKFVDHCICKGMGICNYCKVKKICKEFLCCHRQKHSKHSNQQPEKLRHRSSRLPCERRSSDLFAVCGASSEDCRPYLARVFSEIKDIYAPRNCEREPLEKSPNCEKVIRGLEFVRDAVQVGGSNVKTMQQEQCKIIQRQMEKNRKDEAKFLENKKKQKQKKPHRLEAGSCPCGDFRALNRGLRKKKPKKRVGLYAYSIENKCHDLARHKPCLDMPRNTVPRHMGWLWNLESNGFHRGWKPGAIRKPIKEIMRYFLRDFPVDTIRVSQYAHRTPKHCAEEKKEEELVQHPTLHICKKKDEYFITLRPLKDPESLKCSANPYLPMKPVTFRIIKNPQMIQLRNLKCAIKQMGFPKCTCHKPVAECFCRDFIEKKRLDYVLEQECRQRCMPCCAEQLVLTDTSESEEEFDFGVTPPAGVIKPHLRKKPDLINQGTQYMQSDWLTPPVYPRPPNRYAGYIDCAALSAQEYGGFGGAAGGPFGPGGICSKGPPQKGGKDKGYVAGGKGGRGGRGGKGAGGEGADGEGGADGKGGKGQRGPINMMAYLKSGRAGAGGDRQAALERRRRLTEMPPPIVCTVQRRGKPVDPCGPCYDPCDRIC